MSNERHVEVDGEVFSRVDRRLICDVPADSKITLCLNGAISAGGNDGHWLQATLVIHQLERRLLSSIFDRHVHVQCAHRRDLHLSRFGSGFRANRRPGESQQYTP